MKGGLPIDSTASLSRKDVSLMGFEIILWDEEEHKQAADEITEHPATRIGSVSFVDAKMLENNEKSKT